MEDSNRTHQSTYQYKKPFRFMGAEYTDSRSLADAFIDNWDIAASVFRRGSMEGFWEEYVQEADGQSIDLSAADAFFHRAHSQMWDIDTFFNDVEVAVDAIFQVILHNIEPALNGIPFVRAENNEAKVYSIEELGNWLLSLSAGDKWIDRGYGWIEDEFDAEKWNRTFVLDAAEHNVFSAYVPGTEEAEDKFYRADDAQKCRFLGELALKLQGKECFWYQNVFYTSMEELAPVMKEQLSKGVDVQLFRDLFDSDEYSASFDSWSAKVDGGKYQEKLSELKKSWHKLKEKLPHNDRIQMTIEYSTCDSLLDQFPLVNTEIKFFLKQKYSAALEKVISIQEEYIYNMAIKAVFVNTGLLYLETARDKSESLLSYLETARDKQEGFLSYLENDMGQILKTARDKIQSLEPYLENEEEYNDELERAIACFDEKQLASGWNEANREGKILLLASGWHSLPAGEPNQAAALVEKITESWQKDKDLSILVDAGEVLLSVLQKGISGGWDRTSAEGASAYEQCLELIDRVSGLCIGVDSAELAEKWNKICEIINTKSIEPYEQAFFEFSEKYQKDEDTVISIVKKSGCFDGITYDDEKKVAIKLTETAGGEKYPKSVITMIRKGCQTASDYLSDYRQQIEKLDRELSAIRETGCHYGKIREDLEEHKRFMDALKNAEDHLKKSFADADPLMEEVERRMLETDRINKEIEEERKKEREAKRKEEKEKERLRIEAETRKKIKKAKRRAFFRKHRILITVFTVILAALVLFYLRYVSPAYHGTKFYLGNRINYPEYIIADSVERVYSRSIKGVPLLANEVQLKNLLDRRERERMERSLPKSLIRCAIF